MLEELTYQQILGRMEQVYQEKSGFVPEEISDLGIRLRVLAGELYNLQSGMHWLKAQAFPQTASGEFLEYHAEQRGIYRRGASAATGKLTFGRANPVNYELRIPKGTICALASNDAVRFVTTEEAILPAGTLSVAVSAVAEKGGAEYNAVIGAVTQMITPPVGIETVTNKTIFFGGSAVETDEALRKRLYHRFKNRGNGTNKGFYSSFVADYDGVYSANTVAVEGENDNVIVYVCGKEGGVPTELRKQIQRDLNAKKEINVIAAVLNATEKAIDVACYVTPSEPYTLEEITPKCEALIRTYISELQIGEPFIVAQAMQCLMNAGLIRNYRLYSYTTDVVLEANERGVCNSILLTELT